LNGLDTSNRLEFVLFASFCNLPFAMFLLWFLLCQALRDDLMAHLGGSGIGSFRDQGYAEGLVAVFTDNFHGIVIGILNRFFLDPKQ